MKWSVVRPNRCILQKASRSNFLSCVNLKHDTAIAFLYTLWNIKNVAVNLCQ